MKPDETAAARDHKVAFLAEYADLAKKHCVVVSACGCCESPWLSVLEFGRDGKQTYGPDLDLHIEHLGAGI